jgi:hypothetical protein
MESVNNLCASNDTIKATGDRLSLKMPGQLRKYRCPDLQGPVFDGGVNTTEFAALLPIGQIQR